MCVCPPVVFETPSLEQVKEHGPKGLDSQPHIAPELVLDSIEQALELSWPRIQRLLDAVEHRLGRDGGWRSSPFGPCSFTWSSIGVSTTGGQTHTIRTPPLVLVVQRLRERHHGRLGAPSRCPGADSAANRPASRTG